MDIFIAGKRRHPLHYPGAYHRQYSSDSILVWKYRPRTGHFWPTKALPWPKTRPKKISPVKTTWSCVEIWVRCPEKHQIGIAPNATTPSIWRVIQNPCEVSFILCSCLEFCQKHFETICPLSNILSVEKKKSKNRKYRYLSVEIFFSVLRLVSGGLFYKDHFLKRILDNSQNYRCSIPGQWTFLLSFPAIAGFLIQNVRSPGLLLRQFCELSKIL